MGKPKRSWGTGVGKGHGGNTPNLPVIYPHPFEQWQKIGLEEDSKRFKAGKLIAIVSHSQFGYHMSISHPQRYPTWDEVAYLRYALVPNEVTMAMELPPKEEYINIHNFCFQLWEIPSQTREVMHKITVQDGQVISIEKE